VLEVVIACAVQVRVFLRVQRTCAEPLLVFPHGASLYALLPALVTAL
jgi:hypothetical protein